MTFTWPIVLVGLFLVPIVVLLYIGYDGWRRDSAVDFGNPDLLPNVVDREPGRLRHLPLVDPPRRARDDDRRRRATAREREGKREEATVILAMDTSRSMGATDVSPTRLDAARAAAKSFVAKVPKKFRIGVVSFATRAVVGLPPTADRSLVDASLDTLQPGEGTAIGDGVALSVQLGQKIRGADGTSPPKAVVLISDGAREGGRVSPETAAARARAQHVPVYSVLVGTQNGVVHQKLTGGFDQIIRVPASPGDARADREDLGRSSSSTAPSTDRLRQVYEDLGSRLGTRTESREITDWFAAGAAMLLLVGGTLSAFLFRRVP